MSIRTDLALELNNKKIKGTKTYEKVTENIKTTLTEIETKQASQLLLKPVGRYITVEFGNIEKIADYTSLKMAFRDALNEVFPEKRDNVLAVGLGNREITADSIGPKTAEKILATRHIAGKLAQSVGLGGIKSVSVICPNVLGKTGIEATELVKGAVKAVRPQAVIVIDALASKSVSRLFTSVQISNTGITPGSGVKNSRRALNFEALGVPVVAVGVPTVMDIGTIALQQGVPAQSADCDMIVTPKDADLLSHRISELLAQAINVFLQPEIEEGIIEQLV